MAANKRDKLTKNRKNQKSLKIKRRCRERFEPKKIQCKICGQSFSKTNNLTRHIRFKHISKKDKQNQDLYKCQFCDTRVYEHRRNLSSHLRKQHGKNIVEASQLAQQCDTIKRHEYGKI